MLLPRSPRCQYSTSSLLGVSPDFYTVVEARQTPGRPSYSKVSEPGRRVTLQGRSAAEDARRALTCRPGVEMIPWKVGREPLELLSGAGIALRAPHSVAPRRKADRA